MPAPQFNPVTDLPLAYTDSGSYDPNPVAAEVTRDQFAALALLNGWQPAVVETLMSGRMPAGQRRMGRLRLTIVGDDA